MTDSEGVEYDLVKFTHEELMEITTTALNELLAEDTFLCDLPRSVTLEEVNNQVALQYGRSITIHVVREDDEKMPVIVGKLNVISNVLKGANLYIFKIKIFFLGTPG